MKWYWFSVTIIFSAATAMADSFMAIEFLEGQVKKPAIEKLEFEPIEGISDHDAKEKLKGKWRRAYHCDGAPLYDYQNSQSNRGKKLLHPIFGGERLIVTYLDGAFMRHLANGEKQQLVDTTTYRIERAVDGEFTISYGKFVPETVRFVSIYPVRGIGLVIQNSTKLGTCGKEKKIPVDMLMIKESAEVF